jgi:hypothetical protein
VSGTIDVATGDEENTQDSKQPPFPAVALHLFASGVWRAAEAKLAIPTL